MQVAFHTTAMQQKLAQHNSSSKITNKHHSVEQWTLCFERNPPRSLCSTRPTNKHSLKPSSSSMASSLTFTEVKKVFSIADIEAWGGSCPIDCLWKQAHREVSGKQAYSQFGVVKYSLSGQSVHLLTPTCQRVEEYQDVTKEKTVSGFQIKSNPERKNDIILILWSYRTW